ncbi:alcohol dehydrogenase-like 4 [Glycine soja]|uniref:alcohol dehydrogenase n=1 Tax=Glycine soja TaxID=3848 RepID=A0A0B2PVI5_GLYSO|nr:alcohol dehydrogenase-like 4 [Glycine soja]KHN13321.1 Alcohol dehydrogenase-like 3 [Glycine soja]RZC29538.1 Alcohol dehydrogenase-like 3 isoform A [Glycine soja]
MASSVVVANGNLNPNDTRGKTITCKAAVAYGPGEPFVVERILVHPPQKIEVRIKILFTTICHTDLTAWQGENEARRAYPRIFGHEASGIVESVGEGVSDMNEGDLVVPIFNGECGDCKYCKCEKTNKCERFGVDAMKKVMVSDGATRFYTMDGKPIFHFLNTSTFTEYTVVDSACIVKIHIDGSNGDLNRNIKRLTLLSCGVSSGVGAAWNTADVHFGSTVAVFGLGVVGLAVAEGARARGASRIIGVDINSDKFIKAREMGITDFINPKDDERPVYEIIGEMTGGGVHYSFECAGNLNVLRDAFLSAHEGWGLTVLVGIHLSPKMLPIHPMELFHGRRIVGSNFGGIKGKTQLPHFAKECMNGVVKLDDFITHELPFKEINQAFDLLTTGKSLRCLLHF